MDNNIQRGENNNSRLITFLLCFYICIWGWASNNKTNFCRYEMIFDEYIPEISRQEKRTSRITKLGRLVKSYSKKERKKRREGIYSHPQLQQILMLRGSQLRPGNLLGSCVLNRLIYPANSVTFICQNVKRIHTARWNYNVSLV